jgi:hypothetical protein
LTPKEDISGFENVGPFTRDLLKGITATGTGETIAWPTLTTVAGTLELPSGVYDMDIELTVSNGASIDSETTKAHRTEVVYIYSYLTTPATYEFTDLDVQKLYLTGPKPRLTIDDDFNTIGDYVAQSFSLYNLAGDIIPFYRTNTAAGTTMETSYSFTSPVLPDGGTWAVYIPGYAVTSDVEQPSIVTSGTSEIVMATVYSGIANPVEKKISIKSKRDSVYDHADLETHRRNVRVVTALIPGTTTGITAPQFNDGSVTSYTSHYVAEGHDVNVRAFIGAPSDYRVSYIDVEDDTGLISTSDFNPSLASDTAGWNRWVNGFSVSQGISEITVTVHYFHTGDVVRGSHTISGNQIDQSNPNAEYTIAYVNSGAEHAGTLSSFTVLDTRNDTPTTAYSANSGFNAWDFDGRNFSLTTISQLGYVLAQSRINTSTYLVQGSTQPAIPARYWSSSQGTTTNIYSRTGVSGSYGYSLENFMAYVYKDNSIVAHRTTTVPTFNLSSFDPRPMTAFGVAVPFTNIGTTYYDGNGTINASYNPITFSIDSSSDTGYVQLVKTVTIP